MFRINSQKIYFFKQKKLYENKNLFSRTITKQAYVVVDALDKIRKKEKEKKGIFNTIWNHKKTITLHTIYGSRPSKINNFFLFGHLSPFSLIEILS